MILQVTNYNPHRKLTWQVGTSTMNEDRFPIERWGGFSNPPFPSSPQPLVATAKDNETVTDTPSIITGDTYTLYLDTSVLQLGQTYVTGQQKFQEKWTVGEKSSTKISRKYALT